MDTPAALRPLDEAAESIRRLGEYRTTAELSSAVEAVGAAVERSLRTLLRSDDAAPDDHRLSALSDSFPLDGVVQSLRARERISLELAGGIHELQAATERASQGAVRPGDADVARRVAEGLREELRQAPPESIAPEPAPPEWPAGPPESTTGTPEPVARYPGGRRRWMAWLGAALAASVILGLAWVLARGDDRSYDDAVAAFRAGRLDSAAVGFEAILEDNPDDVTALLYLARIYRRESRRPEAVEVLRSAARLAPEDPDVRRELGHLFMDAGQPRFAVRQYQRALEYEPEDVRSWAGLIRALRAAGDPRAEELLRDAPPDVQAALGRAPDTSGA